MQQNNLFQFENSQKGVSLIISFFVMIIIVAVVLSITTLLYNEIKMIRNIGNSVVAFYAADSGVEKILYYDRKIASGDVHGICSMFDYDNLSNTDKCPSVEDNSEIDPALNCNQIDGVEFLTINDGGDSNSCDADVCDNCTIQFETEYNNKKYTVTAIVAPDDGDPALTVNSLGDYKELTRKIELDMTALQANELIKVSAYATPVSQQSGEGYKISIVAEIEAVEGVSLVLAYIKTSPNEEWDSIYSNRLLDSNNGDFELDGSLTDGTWTGEWPVSDTIADPGIYYVDIYILDAAGNTLVKSNLQPWYLE